MLKKVFVIASLVASALLPAWSADKVLTIPLADSTRNQLNEIGKLRLTRAETEGKIVNGRLVRVDMSIFNEPVLRINLGDTVAVLKRKSLEKPPSADYTFWSGSEHGDDPEQSSFSFKPAEQEVSGTVRYRSRVFSLIHLQGDIHLFGEVDPKHRQLVDRPDSEDPPEVKKKMQELLDQLKSKRSQSAAPADRVALAGPTTLNILFAYTAKASQIINVNQLADNSVQQFNQILANNRIPVTVAKVGMVQSYFVENQTRDKDSPLFYVLMENSVHSARDDTNADVVLILADIDSTVSCGRATRTYVTGPEQAFASISASDACFRSYTVAHEVGHLMGADHNAGSTTGTPYDWARGYYYATNNPTICYYTVMSYPITTVIKKGFNCGTVEKQLPYFSTPSQTAGVYEQGTGKYMGEYPLGSGSANNAAVVNERLPVFSKFRDTKLTLGGKASAIINMLFNFVTDGS